MKRLFAILAFIIVLLSALTCLYSQSIYNNDEYGLNVETQDGWEVFTEVDDPVYGLFIIAWKMPPIFGEMEGLDVFNYISVTAMKSGSITNVYDLATRDQQLIQSQIKTTTRIDSLGYLCYQYQVVQNNQELIARSAYFYENSIGYVVTLTAIEETFVSGLFEFDYLLGTMLFFEPDETGIQAGNLPGLKFDGLYVADISAAIDMTYMYLRFYDDSTVYVQYSDSYSPQEVVAWFGKDWDWDEAGYYSVAGRDVAFTVSSDIWSDYTYEYREEICEGKISSEGKILLRINYLDGTHYEFLFDFVPDVASLSEEEQY